MSMTNFKATIVLIAASALAAWAQPEKPSVFPNDSKDPKVSGGAALLETVCRGDVVVGKDVQCKIPCPKLAIYP